MSAPNLQNRELYLVTYEYSFNALNPYHTRYTQQTEPKYVTEHRTAHEFISRQQIADYIKRKSAKFYRVEEVFPEVKQVVEIKV